MLSRPTRFQLVGAKSSLITRSSAHKVERGFYPGQNPISATHSPKSSSQRRHPLPATQQGGSAVSNPIVQIPKRPLMPKLIKRLMLTQQVIMTLVVVGAIATLGLYSLAFKNQEAWNKAHSRLQLLQRNEKDITIINETLKYQLVQEAENPYHGFIPQDKNTLIFVSPGLPQRPILSMESQTTELPCEHLICTPVTTPTGY